MLKSIRGMPDILPSETTLWQFLESSVKSVAQQYGFTEIRMPIVEKTALFTGAIGEVTDIVSREMYTFEDRKGEGLSLRPEGTAGCVRAIIQHNLLHVSPQRLWYYGPMFRYERPQKGRQRQFNQFGIELYGVEAAVADLEVILLSARLWSVLEIEGLQLEINSLGTVDERAVYREKLQEYLRDNIDVLDDDSKRRLETNPLRVLDSKNPDLQKLIENAPVLIDFLGEESQQHFEKICKGLDTAGINYKVNTHLVRGLDYYSRTVFEWVTDKLGSQAAVCAGGRYDSLVEKQGGRATAAVGFAMGAERIIELLKISKQDIIEQGDVYFIATGDAEQMQAMTLAEQLRSELPYLQIVQDISGGKFKAQFKRADRAASRYAVIIGEDELMQNTVTIKDMSGKSDWKQQIIEQNQLVTFLQNLIPAKG